MTTSSRDGTGVCRGLLTIALASAVSAVVLGVIALLTATDGDVRLVPDSELRHGPILALVLTVVALISAVGGTVLAWWPTARKTIRRPIARWYLVILVLVLLGGVWPARTQLADDLLSLVGPGSPPTTPFGIVAVLLAAVSITSTAIAMAALARTDPTAAGSSPRLRWSVATLVVTLVVSAAWATGWTASLTDPGAKQISDARAGTESVALGDVTAVAYRKVYATPVEMIPTPTGYLTSDGTTVTSIDVSSGQPLWSLAEKTLRSRSSIDSSDYNPRYFVDTSGVDTVIAAADGRITGLDLASGKTLWWTDADVRLVDVGGGVVVVGRHSDDTSSDDEDTKPPTLVGIDARSGSTLWSRTLPGGGGRCTINGPIVDGVLMYIGCEGRLAELDTRSGQNISVQNPGVIQRVTSLGRAFGVYVLSEDRTDDSGDRTVIYRPRAAVPAARIAARTVSPLIGDALITGGPDGDSRRFVLRTLGTGEIRDLDLGRGIRTPSLEPWAASNNILLAAVEKPSAPDENVLAAYDPRTGSLSTKPVPCLTDGAEARVSVIADRVVVQCIRENPQYADVFEMVVLRR